MNMREAQLHSPRGLRIYSEVLSSRLILGSAGYPSPAVLTEAIRAAGVNAVTVSLRREMGGGRTGSAFLDLIAALDVKVLPNTAGCRNAREAITTAQMAREYFDTSWIKLEVIANEDTLQPDVFGLVEAAQDLIRDGFKVLPYATEDLSVAERLQRAGCEVIMPWAAPIGTARGIINVSSLKSLRAYFPDVTLIVDAGIGAPSHAAAAMELGFDGVLLNTAVAKAGDPVRMADAVARAIAAGRMGFEAGLMPPRDTAVPSTPVAGTPFFDFNSQS